jgi:hypothetical protein
LRSSFVQESHPIQDCGACGSEIHDAVEFVRGVVFGSACPRRSQFSGQSAVFFTARENVNLASPVNRHLDGDVGGSTESDEAEALSGLDLTLSKRPVADDPCAEERGGLLVGKDGRNRIGKLLGNGDVFCVATVDMVSCEAGIVAKVLFALLGIFTIALSGIEPCHSGSISFLESGGVFAFIFYDSYDLVTGDYGKLDFRKLALDSVEVCVADATDMDADENLLGTGFWSEDIGQFERVLLDEGKFVKEHGFHDRFLWQKL